ncbi:hypothetical protein JOE63_002876 [Cellulosimicrobium cellulans]|jgi:hypothetical protein|uniref:hypothetical protein n=1 Tax=Cellulosimicrobium cellulans TaxID=1710 RepID=UPI001956CC00|nr:hypothetical protein [Cellulosimicrobium cellulans]MBM7820399.1 hypothetical protein [Cellulosimicrobium cellulans]
MIARTAAGLVTTIVALLCIVLAAMPSAALSYSYQAGHPMYFGGPRSGVLCTGSYTITGTSGSFPVTAAHCATPRTTVFGTDAAWGAVAYSKTYPNTDTALVRASGGVGLYQVVVDPRTGATPGDGRVTGILRTNAQVRDALVGKMGATSGWQEGRITFWGYHPQYGGVLVCHTATTLAGDSGGPVWRLDEHGLRAVGITVLRLADGSGGCYHPIDHVLKAWGARLNVFPSGSVTYSEATLSVPGSLPFVNLTLGGASARSTPSSGDTPGTPGRDAPTVVVTY